MKSRHAQLLSPPVSFAFEYSSGRSRGVLRHVAIPLPSRALPAHPTLLLVSFPRRLKPHRLQTVRRSSGVDRPTGGVFFNRPTSVFVCTPAILSTAPGSASFRRLPPHKLFLVHHSVTVAALSTNVSRHRCAPCTPSARDRQHRPSPLIARLRRR